jgi:hypothetical protein
MNDHRPTRADTANANETATKQENETMLALVHIPTAWQ